MANWFDGLKCDEGCDRDLKACMDAPCESRAHWLASEAEVSVHECSPRFMDPVAWASENRADPEAWADLELHDALHPFGYGH
jgi:hypothetical protein